MNKKRYAASAVVFLILGALIYLQFRTWRNFDWARLFQYGLSWRHIFQGVALIYFAYILRRCGGRFFCGRCARRRLSWSRLADGHRIHGTRLAGPAWGDDSSLFNSPPREPAVCLAGCGLGRGANF